MSFAVRDSSRRYNPAMGDPPHRTRETSGRTAVYAGERRVDRLRARPRRSGAVPVHARHSLHRLPRQALDDAAVCRVRDAGRDQRALPSAARGGRHRAQRRVRSADADGPRSRSRALARRSREVRRQRDLARRHGGAVRRHRPRRDHHVDDDQRSGVDDPGDVSGAGRAARARTGRRCRARFRTTS